MKKYFIVLFSVLLALSVSCKKQPESQSSNNSNPFATAKIENKLIEYYLEESGEITPRSVVKVKFNLTGKVVKLYKESGDRCVYGETLAVIQPDINQIQTMNSAEIAYQKALANLQTVSNQLQEAQTLNQQGLIARASFDSIRNDYDIAQSEVVQARLELESLRESSGTVSGRQMVNTRSPATGTIINRYIDVGDYIIAASPYQSGTVLFEIADTSDMIVEAKINEIDIVNVADNAEVEIEISAIKDKRFTGRVYRIFPTPETEDNVKRYIVQIQPVEHFPSTILPGMSARIRVQTVHKDNAPSIPISCVMRDSEERQDFVYVCVDDRNNIFEKRVIETGVRDFQRIEVVSGLETNDQIAVNPFMIPEESIRNPDSATTNQEEDRRPSGGPGGFRGR